MTLQMSVNGVKCPHNPLSFFFPPCRMRRLKGLSASLSLRSTEPVNVAKNSE